MFRPVCVGWGSPRSYGELRTIADDVTVEGLARNRLIAITIPPDEPVGVDTNPADSNGRATGSPANRFYPDLPLFNLVDTVAPLPSPLF